MTDIPDNVDLQWIARHLVDFRAETRADIEQLKDEVFVLTALMQRMDHKLDRLTRRVDALEQRQP